MPENMQNGKKNVKSYSGSALKSLFFAAGLLVFLILQTNTCPAAKMPAPLLKHYSTRTVIFWKIRQINISPVFDEPESTVIDFYFEKPGKLYVAAPEQDIFIKGDTLWTYLIADKQVQKRTGGQAFNPFNFIDSTQSSYKVVQAEKRKVILKAKTEGLEPDSLAIFI